MAKNGTKKFLAQNSALGKALLPVELRYGEGWVGDRAGRLMEVR